MGNRSLTLLAAVLLIVGALNAWALYVGLGQVQLSIREKPLPAASTSISLDNVVPLSNNRFALISGGRISIYRVDAQNRVTRVNDVDAYEQKLKPYKYSY